MKPIYGRNRTDRKSNGDWHELFMTDVVDEAVAKEYEDACEGELKQAERKEDAEKGIRNRQKSERILATGAVVFGTCLLLAAAMGKLNAMMQKSPALMVLTFGYLIGFGVYEVYIRMIRKKKCAGEAVANGEENTEDVAENSTPAAEDAAARLYASLGVPDNAKRVDVLTFSYKTVNGEVVVDKVSGVNDFMNVEMRMFRDGDSLCLADELGRYTFSREIMNGFLHVREESAVWFWNKSVPFDQGEYGSYGMEKNDRDHVVFHGYYILKLEKDGESYGLYFPDYEETVLREFWGDEFGDRPL